MSDDALILAARDGDARAFEALLDRHEGAVLRVLRLMGVDAQDREDVAQEVFIRLFRHLGGFRSGKPFGPWVYRVTVNAAYDWRLRRGRAAREEVPLGEGVEDLAEGPATGDDPGDAADLRRRLEAALETLSDRERAVFVLREIEGLETSEIARALGVTSITIRRHLGLARRRLRRVLGAGQI